MTFIISDDLVFHFTINTIIFSLFDHPLHNLLDINHPRFVKQITAINHSHFRSL